MSAIRLQRTARTRRPKVIPGTRPSPCGLIRVDRTRDLSTGELSTFRSNRGSDRATSGPFAFVARSRLSRHFDRSAKRGAEKSSRFGAGPLGRKISCISPTCPRCYGVGGGSGRETGDFPVLETVAELGSPPAVPANPNSRLVRPARPQLQGRVMERIVVGIDVAKDGLDVHVRPSGEAKRKSRSLRKGLTPKG